MEQRQYTFHSTQIGEKGVTRTTAEENLIWSAAYWRLFSLLYCDIHSYWFGRNSKPILKALALATVIGIGVRQIDDFLYIVEHHNLFMLALSVFTTEKPKKARSVYSVYKALKRWASVGDRRRVKCNWKFQIHEDERQLWRESVAEAQHFVSTMPSVTWIWSHYDEGHPEKKETIPLFSYNFILLLESIVYATHL